MSSHENLPPFSLRVRGPIACFTRPELKAERMSYPLMTPSAARGVLEAVLWKPAIRWRIERIKVLAPIVFTSFRRNEVGTIAAAPSKSLITSGGKFDDFFIEERRQQRNTVALRDVDYVIEARFDMTCLLYTSSIHFLKRACFSSFRICSWTSERGCAVTSSARNR